MEFTGKIALVTGGSRGIGRAICLELAARGADIALNYCGNAAAAEETRALCLAQGVRAVAIQADVSDFAACERMFRACEQELGPPAILVNNAGIVRDALLPRMAAEDWDAVLDTNLKGAFHCCKLAFRPLSKQGGGRIVNIASVIGITGHAGQANYAASKAGLIGLSKSLAQEYARRRITVNVVAPGFIMTEMTAALSAEARENILAATPLDCLGAPEDVARAVAFLAGEGAAFITGQVLAVDGGLSL